MLNVYFKQSFKDGCVFAFLQENAFSLNFVLFWNPLLKCLQLFINFSQLFFTSQGIGVYCRLNDTKCVPAVFFWFCSTLFSPLPCVPPTLSIQLDQTQTHDSCSSEFSYSLLSDEEGDDAVVFALPLSLITAANSNRSVATYSHHRVLLASPA